MNEDLVKSPGYVDGLYLDVPNLVIFVVFFSFEKIRDSVNISCSRGHYDLEILSLQKDPFEETE